MNNKILLGLAGSVSLFLVCTAVGADPQNGPGALVQYWSLNGYSGGSAPITADVGGGTFTATDASASLSSVSGSTGNLYGGYTAGEAIRWTNPSQFWVDSLTLQFNRNGQTDFVLTYDVEAPGSGKQNAWFWSTDGVNYTLAAALDVSNTGSWQTKTVDLTQATALNSATTIYLKSDFSGCFGPGYMSFDNIQVTTIPEPSMMLFGLGGLGLAMLRRIWIRS